MSEVLVGWSTVKAMLGNKLVPGWLDRYLARNGYDSQQTDQPEDPSRPSNLWSPVAGPFEAHGDFDQEARPATSEMALVKHRGLVRSALVLVAAGVFYLAARIAA